MRTLVLIFLLAGIPLTRSLGDELQMTNVVKASLMFREESNPSAHYPHLVLVYLCLENRHDSDVSWVCDSVWGVEAELLDPQGNPVTQPGSAGSITSRPYGYTLPHGSRLEWMLPHGGVSMFHASQEPQTQEQCALVVGGRGWLIPRESLSSYSLRLRVRGWPWTRFDPPIGSAGREKVLFDVPATKVIVK